MKTRRLQAAVAWLLFGALGCVGADQMKLDAAELLIDKLAVAPGQRVADVGAGDGVIAFRLAEAVGPSGRVYAVEIAPPLLEELNLKASRAAHHNVEVVTASEGDPNLPEPVEIIVLRHVYHHLEDPVAYFTNTRRYLQGDGRLVIIELHDVPWYYFHWAHQSDPATVKREMHEAGYRFVDEYAREYERFLVFSLRD